MNSKKTYFDISINIFNELLKIEPKIEINRPAIETFLKTYVDAHYEVIKKYGDYSSLNKIFIRQICSYYETVFELDSKLLEIILSKSYNHIEKLFKTDINECVIIYPSFRHKRNENSSISHIPIVEIYILNKDNTLNINPDIINDNLDNFSEFLRACAFDIAEHWTKDKKATKAEISDIAFEIIALITIENKAAYKEDVITYLAKETNKKLLRFL